MSTSSSGLSQNGPFSISLSWMNAALLTRMSSRPFCSFLTCANRRFTSRSSAWSQATATPLPPALVTSSAVPATAGIGKLPWVGRHGSERARGPYRPIKSGAWRTLLGRFWAFLLVDGHREALAGLVAGSVRGRAIHRGGPEHEGAARGRAAG